MREYLILFIPILIGLLLALVGFLLKDRPKGKVKNGICTEALIIDFATRDALFKGVSYKAVSPIVEFINSQNNAVKAVYPFFIDVEKMTLKRGDTINICYDPSNVNRFHIVNDGSKSRISFILIFVGIFMIFANLALVIQYY